MDNGSNSSNTNNTLPAVAETPSPSPARPIGVFNSIPAFVEAQRIGKALAMSGLVPQTLYRDNMANCLIALDLAQRMNMPVLTIMQALHVIHGRPGWASTFVIAAINSCGEFSPLRFEVRGEGDEAGCRAWANDVRSGERLDGTWVTIKMAKRERWYDREGSKWPTMADQMLHYRAASFFGRLYAPHILNGMQTIEEIEDVSPPRSGASELHAILQGTDDGGGNAGGGDAAVTVETRKRRRHRKAPEAIDGASGEDAPPPASGAEDKPPEDKPPSGEAQGFF